MNASRNIELEKNKSAIPVPLS